MTATDPAAAAAKVGVYSAVAVGSGEIRTGVSEMGAIWVRSPVAERKKWLTMAVS